MILSKPLTALFFGLSAAVLAAGCATTDSAPSETRVAQSAIRPGARCETGDTGEAADGCNTCTCALSSWQCTELACDQPSNDEFASDEVEGDAPEGNDDDEVASPALETECTNGDTTSFDDCNTCTCTDDVWRCTELACDSGNGGSSGSNDASDDLPSAESECTDGQRGWLDCNTCECYSGHWRCTELACGG